MTWKAIHGNAKNLYLNLIGDLKEREAIIAALFHWKVVLFFTNILGVRPTATYILYHILIRDPELDPVLAQRVGVFQLRFKMETRPEGEPQKVCRHGLDAQSLIVMVNAYYSQLQGIFI
jgi:hypothetical protein